MVPYVVDAVHVLLFLLHLCMPRDCYDARVTAILV